MIKILTIIILLIILFKNINNTLLETMYNYSDCYLNLCQNFIKPYFLPNYHNNYYYQLNNYKQIPLPNKYLQPDLPLPII